MLFISPSTLYSMPRNLEMNQQLSSTRGSCGRRAIIGKPFRVSREPLIAMHSYRTTRVSKLLALLELSGRTNKISLRREHICYLLNGWIALAKHIQQPCGLNINWPQGHTRTGRKVTTISAATTINCSSQKRLSPQIYEVRHTFQEKPLNLSLRTTCAPYLLGRSIYIKHYHDS